MDRVLQESRKISNASRIPPTGGLCRRSGRQAAVFAFGAVVAVSHGAESNRPESDGGTSESGERAYTLRLNLNDLYVEAASSIDQRRVRSERSGQAHRTQVNRDLRYSEAMGLQFDGSLFDPNFLEWHGGLKFGLSQERYREEQDGFRRTDSDDGLLLEYDFALEAFRTKPLSLSAYARKSRDRVPRRFLPSLIEENSEGGASLLALTGSWTTELGFSWSDLDRTGNRRDLDDERHENTRFYLDSRGELSDRQKLHLTYNREREETSYQGSYTDLKTDRDELRIDHEWAFGALGEHRLDTFLRSNNESGDLARDELEFGPRLTLRHSDEFQTVYRYDYYDYEQDAISISRNKASFEAIYTPNRRWRISGDVFALREKVEDDLETDEYGASVDASYRQPTGWGELTANAAFAVDRVQTQGSADRGLVRGEVHVLDTVRPAMLLRPDVELWTILAYNAARTRIYRPGIDYRLLFTGRRTAIVRILSGRISENEPVYFDYAYRVPLGSRVDSYRIDVDVEHPFSIGGPGDSDGPLTRGEVLTPYYRMELRRQSADGSWGTPVYEDNSERHRFGIRLESMRGAKATGGWSVTGEAEIFHDANLPYDAYHLISRAALLRTPTHSVDVSGQLSRYLFQGTYDRRHVWWFNADVADRVQLGPYWSAKVGAAYRHEHDSEDGTTNAVDLEGGVHFTRGYLDVELTAEYDLLAIVENREQGFGLWLNIRRDLSHLLPGRSVSR